MDYIYIGKIVNTHGIKGEVRIISDFSKKEEVFKKDNTLYIGSKKTPLTINSYRIHKKFDMILFKEINDINDVLKYKNMNVYIKKNSINEFYEEEIIGYDVKITNIIGKVEDIINNGMQKLLIIKGKKKYYVPFVDAFINKIDREEKILYINNIEGLIDEN